MWNDEIVMCPRAGGFGQELGVGVGGMEAKMHMTDNKIKNKYK